jgi:hypothetical protein
VTAWRFREARLCCGLGVEACADLLQVTERTIRNWEAGATRIPYAAYRLMRVLRGGKVLGPQWRGFHVWRDHLFTPEGHRFHFSDLAWWSLLVRQAREFRSIVQAKNNLGNPEASVASARIAGLVSLSIKGEQTPAQPRPAVPLSLVPEPPISQLRDTLPGAGVESAGVVPGADTPVGRAQPTADAPLACGGAR